MALNILKHILQCGERTNKLEGYTSTISGSGGLDKIKALRERSSEEIYDRAVDILGTPGGGRGGGEGGGGRGGG